MLTKRIQILLNEEEYKKIKAVGKRTNKSMGEIFREAAKLYGDRLVTRLARLEIVEKMAKLKASVSDWPKMEKQIFKARLG